jgi:hypothetical protein
VVNQEGSTVKTTYTIIYGKIDTIMSAAAAQVIEMPSPADTTIPTDATTESGVDSTVRPLMDFALLTATVQSAALSVKKIVPRQAKR